LERSWGWWGSDRGGGEIGRNISRKKKITQELSKLLAEVDCFISKQQACNPSWKQIYQETPDKNLSYKLHVAGQSIIKHHAL
jgi:hypothetical protein